MYEVKKCSRIFWILIICSCALGCQTASKDANNKAESSSTVATISDDEMDELLAILEEPMASKRLERVENLLSKTSSDDVRFYALGDAAIDSFHLGKIEQARQFSEELLKVLTSFEDDWNYGNAIHQANTVLGLVAVEEGRISDAKAFLIKSGETPGSPQLDSFGPYMHLAKALLDTGESDIVLEYFELCRKFWSYDQLNVWQADVEQGRVPDFRLLPTS